MKTGQEIVDSLYGTRRIKQKILPGVSWVGVGAARNPQVSLCDDGVPARRRDMPGDKQALRSIVGRQAFEGGCKSRRIGLFAIFLLAAREQCAADWRRR